MDEELAWLAGDTDAEFREAAHWWLRLRECGSERRALLGFDDWFTKSAAHRRAFARVESLQETVRRASSELPAAPAARISSAKS